MLPTNLAKQMGKEFAAIAGDSDVCCLKLHDMPNPAAMRDAASVLEQTCHLLRETAHLWELQIPHSEDDD